MVSIIDSTLRDGEQAPGIALGVSEKVSIAQALDAAGIPLIEAGTPAMGGSEQEAIAAIVALGLKAKIFTWNRAKLEDIRASLACGVRHVHISVPVSDLHILKKLGRTRSWVLASLEQALAYARAQDCAVSVGAEDASRAEAGFLLQVACLARDAGALWFRYADTVGRLDPFAIYDAVKGLIEAAGIDVEVHTHNDLGLATANAVAGVRAGARYVTATVNGLGERAGNASLDEIALALEYLYHLPTGLDLARLVPLAHLVAGLAQRPIPVNKPISGANAFACRGRGGDPTLLYLPFNPQGIGLDNSVGG